MKLHRVRPKARVLCAASILAAVTGCATPPVVKPDPKTTSPTPTQVPAQAPIAVVPEVQPAVPAVQAKPEVAVVTPAPDAPGEKELAEGTALYENGDFAKAQRRLLAARDAAPDSTITKQNSLKLLAFTYCLTNQRVLCRQQFDSLLKINPKFELTRSESGHPLWGPVFVQAKRALVAPKR